MSYNTEAPECPYCGYVHQHDGGFLYDESVCEYQCERCEKTFDMLVYTSTSWTCTARKEADTRTRESGGVPRP